MNVASVTVIATIHGLMRGRQTTGAATVVVGANSTAVAAAIMSVRFAKKG